MTKIENIETNVRNRVKKERIKRMVVLILGTVMVIVGAGMVIWSILYTSKRYDSMLLKESMYESEIKEIDPEDLPNDVSGCSDLIVDMTLNGADQKEINKVIEHSKELMDDISEEEKEEIIDKLVEVGEIYPLTPEEIEQAAYEYIKADVEATETAYAELSKDEEDVFKELYEDLPDFDEYLDIPLSHELQVELFADCDIYGVDYALALALMDTESSFRSDIGNEDVLGGEEGGARYYGYFQLSADNCNKATEYGLDAHTPEGNIEMGIKILGNLLLDTDEEWEAIAAYKGGAGYLKDCKEKGVIPKTAQNVLAKKAKYEAMIKGE